MTNAQHTLHEALEALGISSAESNISGKRTLLHGDAVIGDFDAHEAWAYVKIANAIAAAEADLLGEALEALDKAAATIGAVYQWVDRVEQAGGATSISGVAACNAMLKSLRSNRDRMETLVMEPARAILTKSGKDGQ